MLTYAGMKQVFNDIGDEVETYITELILDDLRHSADYIYKWRSRLSNQEKAAIAAAFPSEMNEICRSVDKIWYDLGNEYQVVDEPIVEGLAHRNDRYEALVTINSYDAQVLNTSSLMIVDVDLYDKDGGNFSSAIAYSQKHALLALKAFCETNEDYGFRIYKTKAGLRYICTTHFADPTSFHTERVFRCLLADPLYAQLCRFQETFRARLSPKPWRIGDAEEVSRWEYDRQHGCVIPRKQEWENIRVCKGLGTFGVRKVLPEFKDIIRYHDNATQALVVGDIPLA